jgi:predicted phosphodiesterase
MPKTKVDCICYGHFHTGFIEEQKGVIIANAGSISLPKNNTAHSYLSLCDGNLILKDESGKIIKQISL